MKNYNPIVSLSYFVAMLLGTMFFIHPIFIFISLLCSLLYSFILDRKKTKALLIFGIISVFFIALVNMIFVHRGVTILFYLNNNPITMESIIYGICSGFLLLSILMWMNSYNIIITSEKFLYVFGKILPSIALMVSMTIRLIPKLIKQTKIIIEAQRTLGLDCRCGPYLKRAKASMRVLSILVSWALEDGVVTADSMKARGYGLKGRTTFSLYKFKFKDFLMLSFILIMVILLFLGYKEGIGGFKFYPRIKPLVFNLKEVIIYGGFLALGLFPSFLEIRECIRWKLLKLKM